MVDRREVIGGLFRVFATGGSAFRLVDWCKRKEGRHMRVSVTYQEGEPQWNLILVDVGGVDRFDESSDSLEGVVVRAVVALGKEM